MCLWLRNVPSLSDKQLKYHTFIEPSPPKDLNVEISAENRHMMVHWNTPDELNGNLLNYKICWKEQEEAVVNWTCKVCLFVCVFIYLINEVCCV